MHNESNETLVTARGTGDGLVIRLKSQVAGEDLIQAIKEYVGARKSFLAGNQVMLDWYDGIPADDLNSLVSDCLKKEFDIHIKSTLTSKAPVEQPTGTTKGFQPPRNGGDSDGSGLFAGIENLSSSIEAETTFDLTSNDSAEELSPSALTNSMFWDNPDAMIVHATLRSGQKIETENSIVLVGDVNCGAEIVAGGDVIVLGTLRGVVHAGAYDETGGGRFIFSLDLRPTQLRIGSVISRGMEETERVPEIAYVDGTAIVVEEYNSRNATNRIR